MSGIELVGLAILTIFGAFVMWAVIVACEGCAFTQAGCSGDPALESIGAAHTLARRAGVRLNKAPNQGTRKARFDVLARSGLGANSLMYADARMSGACGWRDLSGRWHAFPNKARTCAI